MDGEEVSIICLSREDGLIWGITRRLVAFSRFRGGEGDQGEAVILPRCLYFVFGIDATVNYVVILARFWGHEYIR